MSRFLLDSSHYSATPRVIADKGYDSDALIELIEQQGAQAVIPSRANRQQPREYD